MIVMNFVAKSNDYKALFDSLLEVKWDINENLIHLTFEDNNPNYIDLINLTKDKNKINIVLDVNCITIDTNNINSSNVIRYYDIELLPVRFIQSELSKVSSLSQTLNAVFKILKSDVNFVEPSNE